MGPNKGEKVKRGGAHRAKVVSLGSREGKTRSFHVANVNEDNLKPTLMQHIAKDTHLMTDDAHHYKKVCASRVHQFTQKEYAKDSKVKGVRAHSKTVESYFGILKRSITGTYHHVSELSITFSGM